MTECSYLKPKKVTDTNDRLDERSYLCIKDLFCDTQAITHEIKYHDKTSNIDGYIQLVDNNNYPIGNIFIQAKSYKKENKNKNKASIPSYFVGYASWMRNEVCIFMSVEASAKRIYWKYISDEYIREYDKSGVKASHIYQFKNAEVITTENVGTTIESWKRIVEEKKALYSKEKRNAEEIIINSYSAFQIISTDFHQLKDSFIERKEIDILYNWVVEELPKEDSRLKLLVGNAGMGKSVVVKKVIQRLEKDGIKCFAIKADRLEITLGQSKNEHLEMLRNTFASLIQEDRAVLVVDQIDALSQYITNDRAKVENVIALINLFSSDEKLSNVRIIVSCRSFDLEFDPKLSLLGNAPQVELKALNKKEVEKVLNQLKDGLYKELNEETISILQTPQHLNLFCRVYLKNNKNNYHSITDLYDELWSQNVDMPDIDINKSNAERVLYELAQKIYDEGTLTPQWENDTSCFKEFNYLVSQGLIERIGNRVTFFHQSMYDYVFARFYTKENRSFIRDLLAEKKHQGLFVRSTVNLVLDYERAKNIKQYKEDVNVILFSGEIRPHLQLVLLWAISNRQDILPFEKKCVRELYIQNKMLFYSFVRRTWSKEWYKVIVPIISSDIKKMKVGDQVFDSIYGYLLNHVHTCTEDVFRGIDTIRDGNTRNTVAQRLLYVTPDYSLDIVTKWYVLCDTFVKKVDFLERAMHSNTQFVLDNIAELFDSIMNNQEIPKHIEESFFENICNPLKDRHTDALYSILKDRIICAINSHRVHSWRESLDLNAVFPSLMSHYHHTYALHELFEELLVKEINKNPNSLVGDIRMLLSQKEVSCYEFAFKAMLEKPLLFSDDIMGILTDNGLVDELLDFGYAEYYFLELIKKWLPLIDEKTLSVCQDIIYNFKSASDSLSDKDRKYTKLLYPHLGYNQRKLIWVIPKNLRSHRIIRRYQELNRRFGDEWNNTKPDHNAIMAHVCGGLMSEDRYKNISEKDWQNSFYGINSYANGKNRYFDSRVHADEFKQCVSERPHDFANLVFKLFEDEHIPAMYALAGLDGLIVGNYPTSQLLPLVWKSIDSFDIQSGYSLCSLLNNLVINDGPYIDKIISFLNGVIISDYVSKYNSDIEDVWRNDSTVNDMLMYGINSIQGYAINTLAKIGKHPHRKSTVYNFFMESGEKLSLEHQLAAMFYLQQECYDNDLYNAVMFKFANRPISDYLFIDANRMHWFWCNNPDLILPYFEMIMDKNRAKPILAQIMFFGIQYEKSKTISRDLFKKLLAQNDVEVIKKMIPLAYDHLSDETYRKQSVIILRKYAKDSRKEIRDTYLLNCHKMPESDINIFKEILQLWIADISVEGRFYDIIRYLKKCYNAYPYESYQCIKNLLEQVSSMNYYEEEEFLKILLACYRNFMDDEEIKKADEVLDIFDTIMLKTNTLRSDELIKKVDKNV